MDDQYLNIRSHRDKNGQLWFCAKDIYKQLKVTWSGSTLRNTPKSLQNSFPVDTPKGDRNAVFLNKETCDFLLANRRAKR